MNIFLLILAGGIAAYGPPNSRDAYEAMTDRFLVDLREMGAVLQESERRKAGDFPSDVYVERCIKKNNRETRTERGVIQFFGGYNCIIEVVPVSEPPYRTFGFFRHDGIEWKYHGPVKTSVLPGASAFDSNGAAGEIILKPGAVIYQGDPKNPLNPDYNPYHDLFDAVGARNDNAIKY